MKSITPKSSLEAGFTRHELYQAVLSGSLEKVARGIYVPNNSPPSDWEMVEAATRRPEATICLISALAHYNLTDEIPAALDVAIPRGTRIPAGRPTIKWHSFDRNSFSVERMEIDIWGSEMRIGIYSPERTIIDAFRLRSEVGYETARDALKEWLRNGGTPAALIEVAKLLPRSLGPILKTLEVLL